MVNGKIENQSFRAGQPSREARTEKPQRENRQPRIALNHYLRFTIYYLRQLTIYDFVGRRDIRVGRSGAVIEPACTGG
jgi:hypothetical protein